MSTSSQPLSPWWIFIALGFITLAGLVAWAFDACRAWRAGRIREWWRKVETDESTRCQLAHLCMCPEFRTRLCQNWRPPEPDPSTLVVQHTGGFDTFVKGKFTVRERLFPPSIGVLGDPLFPPVAGRLHPSASRRIDAALRAVS